MFKKVLVVVDMQNDFLTGVLGNKECEATIPNVVSLINDGDFDAIIYTHDTHSDNYLNTQEGKKLPVPHCLYNTEGWEIQEDILNALLSFDGWVYSINKPSFGSLRLVEIFKEELKNDISEVHFCGVCTGICVISNVMITKAALPEAKVCVHKDACACVTPDSHKTAIEAMKMCQVDIV